MAPSLKCNKSSEFFINAGLFRYEICPDRYLSANYLFGYQLFGKMIWLSLFWVTEIPILLFPNIKKNLKLNETFVNATSCNCLLKCFNCNIPAFSLAIILVQSVLHAMEILKWWIKKTSLKNFMALFFLWMGFNCLKARATPRQFTFNH